jgi:hypothetical protein
MKCLPIMRAFDGIIGNARLLLVLSFIGGVSWVMFPDAALLIEAGYDATWIGIANAALVYP